MMVYGRVRQSKTPYLLARSYRIAKNNYDDVNDSIADCNDMVFTRTQTFAFVILSQHIFHKGFFSLFHCLNFRWDNIFDANGKTICMPAVFMKPLNLSPFQKMQSSWDCNLETGGLWMYNCVQCILQAQFKKKKKSDLGAVHSEWVAFCLLLLVL